MAPGTAAPRAVQVLSLLLVGLLSFRLASQGLKGRGGIPFLLWLQYGSALLASVLLGGYVFSLQRWMFFCGLVALVPAVISGLFNLVMSRLPR